MVDGALHATIQGGIPAYNIVWNPLPSGVTNGEDSIIGIPAGSYTITVQDSNGCIATAVGLVLEPDPILVTVIDTNALCADSNGVIILTATGGPSETNGISDAYMFSIDGGSTFVMG